MSIRNQFLLQLFTTFLLDHMDRIVPNRISSGRPRSDPIQSENIPIVN